MEKNRKINIGTFNFFIGWAILCVILVHTIELFSKDALSPFFRVLFELFSYIGVAGFAMISGYKLRIPNDLKKYIIRTGRDYLKIYYLFGLVTVIVFGIIHFICFQYAKGTLKEMLLLATGFLFGIYPAIPIGNVTIYSCGPLYFVVAFVIAEIILVSILCLAQKYKGIIVITIMLIGSILIKIIPGSPFALTSAMLFTGCIYAGYLLREQELFENNINLKTSLLCLALSFVFYGVKFIPLLKYLELFFKVLSGIFAGIVLINICTVVSRRKSGVVSKLKKIGRVSIFVLGAHTVEYFSIPWYLLAEKCNAVSAEAGVIVIYSLRLVIVFIIVKISLYFLKNGLKVTCFKR